MTGAGGLPSLFPVSDLAAATVGAAGAAIAELIGISGGRPPSVAVDRRLASLWFGLSLRPRGWTVPPAWDRVAGDYATGDGWIRLHTNAPHHRGRALAVLGFDPETEAGRDDVARAVREWTADGLERAVVAAGGCAAAMRSSADWSEHPQGRAVAAAPLIDVVPISAETRWAWRPDRERPLAGLKVLDLTRVLAGPTATRFLGGFGARVLRIDPPFWEEPALVPEMTLGKRCARLDLGRPADRDRLERLLAEADILVHGYRADALAGLGFGEARRRTLNPGLIDISLNAYGWDGPWRNRRGFDSLVQMSTGIAEAAMRHFGSDKPVPLPVQALDMATGHLMAALAVRGVIRRLDSGQGMTARLSLAGTARLMTLLRRKARSEPPIVETSADLGETEEITAWGVARRLRPPVTIKGAPMAWDLPAGPLGADQPSW
ncbi:MAG: acyl-CoA transferase [Telmatospirillum sp.]|nr:acyl-CoA transferase [Telmatospirillum sp.]